MHRSHEAYIQAVVEIGVGGAILVGIVRSHGRSRERQRRVLRHGPVGHSLAAKVAREQVLVAVDDGVDALRAEVVDDGLHDLKAIRVSE